MSQSHRQCACRTGRVRPGPDDSRGPRGETDSEWPNPSRYGVELVRPTRRSDGNGGTPICIEVLNCSEFTGHWNL